MRQRQALIARIMQMRRAGTADETERASQTDALNALETRVAHLEQMVEGLQDSVHRESSRQAKQIADLEAQLEPSSLAVALSKDARQRGL
jgi:uncharacterized coiled-coil protein SlyX